MQCTVTTKTTRRSSSRTVDNTPDLIRMKPNIADHNIANHIGIQRSSSGQNISSSGAANTLALQKGSKRTRDYADGTGSAGSLAHASSYFNSAKNSIYQRYSTSDWDTSNRNNFMEAEKERSHAEQLRADLFRTVKLTDQMTRTRQQCNTRKLGLRVKDIAFWKEELLKEVHNMSEETSNLQEHKRMLEKALADTDTPLSIVEECLTRREKRMGIDLVHDDVERSLTKEVDVIKKCQNRMKRLLEKVDIQLKMNGTAQRACEADKTDKHHAEDIDDRMQQLRNTSSRLGHYPGVEEFDNTVTMPESWIKYTQENLSRSQHEREVSARLRGAVDACIRACANEMWAQHNTVNNSLNARVQQLEGAKEGLHAHLLKTVNEIRDLERAIDLIKAAIEDKEAPLKVAQTRLEERSRRVHVELCNDNPMNVLQAEVREILESMRVLKEKLHAAVQSLVRLQRTKVALENDIAVKESSLDIDRRECIGLLKNVAIDPTRGGANFSMTLTGF